MGVNNLPEVSEQRHLDRKSDALSIVPPRQPSCIKNAKMTKFQ